LFELISSPHHHYISQQADVKDLLFNFATFGMTDGCVRSIFSAIDAITKSGENPFL
jgi:hypothetical protein